MDEYTRYFYSQFSVINQKEVAMLQEFKQFVLRGNVMDLAVGVIIGAAFGKIVDSLVNDIIMPLVSRIFGGLDFSNMFVKLADGPPDVAQTYAALKAAGVPLLAYGNFITIVLNFAILAFVIFLMVRQVNRFRKEAAPAVAVTPEEVLLLREIRDSLHK